MASSVANTWLPVCVLLVACLHPTLSDDEHSARFRRQVTWKQRNIRVVSILTAPYTMKASGGGGYKGYEGFIPDLLELLETRLNLNIDLYIVNDQKYGSLTEDNVTWTGMIGDVIKQEKGQPGGADIAAAPLTITSAREKVVDFLIPFQHHGLTMVVRKPELQPEKDIWAYSFDIVKPLAPEVWAFCTLGIFVVGALLWANNRFNPYEWGGRHNLGRAGENAAESFNMPGAMWFAFTTFQWQGFERAPRSMSSKVLTCFWFAFITITLVTYTGSLVNHLFWASTVHGRDPTQPDIQDLADLVRRNDYDYGYVQGGSTDHYFSNVASGPIFDRMRSYWATARAQNALVPNIEGGLKAIRRTGGRKYVFIMEKYLAEYYANRKPCDIQTVGPLIGKRSFGMAVPQNMETSLSEALHGAILEMIEEGDIDALEQKWWQSMGECWDVIQQERTISQNSALFINKPKVVNLQMFWGPLVLLLVGIVMTILVAIAEILYYKYKGRYQRQNRPGDARLQLDDDTA